jgi:aspartate racemase
MKTLGMIGGVGPESTIDYYRLIIAAYRDRKPDGSYPPIIINSVNLKEMVDLLEANNLAGVASRVIAELQKLANAGADLGILTSNTPHIVFDEVARQSPLPLISIVQATCDAAAGMNLRKLALFGSRYTMQARFYPEVFSRKAIEVVSPNADEQAYIHDRYMKELVNGIFRQETRDGLLKIVGRMKQRDHIDGLILGGTELPLILRDVPDSGIPFLDTTSIHVNAVMEKLEI